MRRIDALAITLAVFLFGGFAYILFQVFGFEQFQAGIWSQVLLAVGLLGWLFTYLFRVGAKKMTYHQQRDTYDRSFLEKRLEALTPEELAKLQAKIEQEKSNN